MPVVALPTAKQGSSLNAPRALPLQATIILIAMVGNPRNCILSLFGSLLFILSNLQIKAS